MLTGFADRLLRLHPQHRPSRRRSSSQFGVLYRFLLNKWYFDELYDVALRPPVALARPLLLEARRRGHDRPLRPRRRRRRGRRRQPRHRAAPVRLSLHLCAGDAARPRRRDDLGDGAVMSRASRSSRRCCALPLLGAIACLLDQRQRRALDRARRPRSATSRSASASGSPTRSAAPQWQFTEYAPLFGRFAWALGIDGIALMLIMLTVFLMPICIAASLDGDREARARIYGRASC